MKFKPMSDLDADTQANAFRLFQRGIYDFEIVEAKERISSAGNNMMEMRVKIFDKEGHFRTIFDYLVDSDATGYKLRHFAKATGLLAHYEKGKMTAQECEGKAGRCQVIIQKDRNNVYPDKNVISDYLPMLAVGAAPATSLEDDEIPF